MDKKTQERVDMVRAMETVARNINDEEVFMGWLMCGVADGDITPETTDENIVDMGYTEDGTFKDLMSCFLRRMVGAYKSGGLYCGGIVSDSKDKEE